MKLRGIQSALVVIVALVAQLSAARTLPSSAPTPQPWHRIQQESTFGRLPLQFEANQGQADAPVKFLAHGRGYNVFLDPGGVLLLLSARTGNRPASTLHLRFVGADPEPQMVGVDPLPGIVNYYVGRDPGKWHTGVPTYAKVKYQAAYPGVDALFYGHQHQLEHDFVVAPGIDPGIIALSVEGAEEIEIDPDGDLVLGADGGEVRLRKPFIYQEFSGVRWPVDGGYVLQGMGQFGFHVGAYDTSRPLIIDPVLDYSTYFGGTEQDYAYGITTDTVGNVYLTGATNSTDLPLANPDQPAFGGGGIDCPSDDTPYRVCYDAFVTKLNAAGTALVYSTYIGMPGDDEGRGIAVDGAGNAYVTGQMSVSGESLPDYYVYKYVLVAKLNPTGGMVYGGWLGTNGSLGRAIAVDAMGRAHLTGEAPGGFLTTPDAIQPDNLEKIEAFVTVLDPSGQNLVYSTNLGGSGEYCELCYSSGYGIAVDNAGMIYVTGQAAASFPTTSNAYQRTFDGFWKAFVVKIDRSRAGAAGLVYSTYLGGTTLSDFGYAIALDADGKVYVTGATQTDDFPTTAGAFDRSCGTDGICNTTDNMVCDYVLPGQPASCHVDAKSDVFVAKLDLSRSGAASLIYSTYVGGGGHESGYAIAVDAAGNAYVTGKTVSPNFPLVNPLQGTIGGNMDAFVFKLSPTGSQLDYSTFLGGGGDDVGTGIATDTAGNAYVSGWTGSVAFPTSSPLRSRAGSWEAFIAKIHVPTLNHRVFLPAVLKR